MNRSILNAFLVDQREAKRIVASNLGVSENIDANAWASMLGEVRVAYEAAPFADIFVPHGYGLELRIGNLYVDYDYSQTGRRDGFDEWRIFAYIVAGTYDNNGPDSQLCDRVFEWVRALVASGEAEKLDNLYYLKSSHNKRA